MSPLVVVYVSHSTQAKLLTCSLAAAARTYERGVKKQSEEEEEGEGRGNLTPHASFTVY